MTRAPNFALRVKSSQSTLPTSRFRAHKTRSSDGIADIDINFCACCYIRESGLETRRQVEGIGDLNKSQDITTKQLLFVATSFARRLRRRILRLHHRPEHLQPEC